MPNPVPVPSGPISLNPTENLRVEAFVQSLLQVMRAGTSGLGDPTLLTDATVFPQANDADPAALHLASRAQQLFYRQLGVAISKNFSGAGEIVIPPYLEETFTSAGLARGVGVYISAPGVVAQGSYDSEAPSRIIGISLGAAAAGASVQVLNTGVISAVLTGATPGAEYFLGPTGLPVLYSAVPDGKHIIRLGIASTTTDLEVRIADYGVR